MIPDSQRDEYDGYANYRKELEPPPGNIRLRNFLRGVLSFLFGMAVTRVVYVIVGPEEGIAKLLIGLFAGVVGLIGLVCCYPLLVGKDLTQSPAWRPRDFIVFLFVVFGLVIPFFAHRAA